MHLSNIDVSKPVFARNTFASATAEQSCKLYMRLAHTSLVVNQLPRGASTSASIEQFAHRYLHSLSDIEALLKTIHNEYKAHGEDAKYGTHRRSDGGSRLAARYSMYDCGPDFSELGGKERSERSRDFPLMEEDSDVPSQARKNRSRFSQLNLKPIQPTDIRSATPLADHSRQSTAAVASPPRSEKERALPRLVEYAFFPPDRFADCGGVSVRHSSQSLDATAECGAVAPREGLSGHGSATTAAVAQPTLPWKKVTANTGSFINGNATAALKGGDGIAGNISASSPVSTLQPAASTRSCDLITTPEDNGISALNVSSSTSSSSVAAGYSPSPARKSPPSRPRAPPFNMPPLKSCLPPLYPVDDRASRELTGWLELLVWMRRAMIFLLRDLATVQSGVVWNSFYWAWAVDHPHQAALHQGLTSLSFWRTLYSSSGGLRSTSAFMRIRTNTHLHALKSIFHLLVSSIGAVHTILESLNELVHGLQKECEVEAAVVHRRTDDTGSFYGDPGQMGFSSFPTGTSNHTMYPGIGSMGRAAICEAAAATSTPRPPFNLVDRLRGAVMTTVYQFINVVQPQGLLFTIAQEEASGHLWLGGGAVAAALSEDLEAFIGVLSAPLDEALTSPQLRRSDQPHAAIAKAGLEEGVSALYYAVACARFYTRKLNDLVIDRHKPPPGRHWLRVLLASGIALPALLWVYPKTPSELAATARSVWQQLTTMVDTYVVVPFQQIRESIFYARPGVEERRRALDRDAESLANIVRDYHEECYPSMPQKKLDALRDHTLECLRAGVADEEGYGLVERDYRNAVKHPIRSTIFGDLPRIILIQMSFQSLEVSRVTNGIDEVLKGNDLNFKVMAIMPVVGVCGLLALWELARWRASFKPVRRRMKLLWRAIHRVISLGSNTSPFYKERDTEWGGIPEGCPTPNLATLDSMHFPESHPQQPEPRPQVPHLQAASPWHRGEESGRAPNTAPGAWGGGMDVYKESAQLLNNYEQGMVLLLVHVMRSTATEFFSGYNFYRVLLEDLDDLESTKNTRQQRLQILQRMLATHTLLA